MPAAPKKRGVAAAAAAAGADVDDDEDGALNPAFSFDFGAAEEKHQSAWDFSGVVQAA